jgi:hypothetical protein
VASAQYATARNFCARVSARSQRYAQRNHPGTTSCAEVIMTHSEYDIGKLKTELVETLAEDSILCQYWSGKPECDVFPDKNSDFYKHVLTTVFLRENVVSGETLAMVIKRQAELVRPHIQVVDEIVALAGWIGAGNTSDRYVRVLRFAVQKEAMDSPLLNSLSGHFSEEYFDEGGISFLRYYPL